MQKLRDELDKLKKQKYIIETNIRLLEKKIQDNSDFEFILKDKIYIDITNLSKNIIDKLKDIASFENPQIQILQSLRKPLFNTPKYIQSFQIKDKTIILPRGLMRDVIEILNSNNIKYRLNDKRLLIQEEFKKIKFDLRQEQLIACEHISKKDFGICVAPPGFGKTLIGAKMISLRGCNTLVVVNKNMLLDQWIQRFVDYFGYDKKDIGFLGKSKNRLNQKLDIATMQSLKNNPSIIKDYSFVIVDECHHIPALTFEKIIDNFEGKYILGLSATPKRKDQMENILFQQVGNIAYEVIKSKTYNNKLKVITTDFTSQVDNFSDLINEIINDKQRNSIIINEILENENRKILVLTDRIEHIHILSKMLDGCGLDYVSVYGAMKNKLKDDNMSKIKSSSLVLATTSFFGEGIDFPHLDTIIFATPISYYGRLVQYLGRIGRGADDSLAIDILDNKNNFTKSAFRKRQDGYKQLYFKRIN